MKGLPARFNIVKGKLQLLGGVEKARENIWFFCIFDKKRNYASDFGANFVSLAQKPASYLTLNRTLILGTLKKGIQKYIPNVTVRNLDIGYLSKDRRNYTLVVDYDVSQEDSSTIQDVTFI